MERCGWRLINVPAANELSDRIAKDLKACVNCYGFYKRYGINCCHPCKKGV